jgi:hypothetical protein
MIGNPSGPRKREREWLGELGDALVSPTDEAIATRWMRYALDDILDEERPALTEGASKVLCHNICMVNKATQEFGVLTAVDAMQTA